MNYRSVLLVDGPYAGKTYSVPQTATVWMFPAPFDVLRPVNFYGNEQLPDLGDDDVCYRLQAVFLLGRRIELGWLVENPRPADSALAEYLLSDAAKKVSS